MTVASCCILGSTFAILATAFDKLSQWGNSDLFNHHMIPLMTTVIHLMTISKKVIKSGALNDCLTNDRSSSPNCSCKVKDYMKDNAYATYHITRICFLGKKYSFLSITFPSIANSL